MYTRIYVYSDVSARFFPCFFRVVPSGWVRVPLFLPPGAIFDVVAVFFGPCILGGYASRFFCRPARYSARRPLRRFILFWFCLPGPRFYYLRVAFTGRQPSQNGTCNFLFFLILAAMPTRRSHTPDGSSHLRTWYGSG